MESALKTDAVSAMVGHGSGGAREMNFFVHYECLGFSTADFWSLVAYESAEQKPKL